MVKALDQNVQPQNAAELPGSLPGGCAACVRRPSEKVLAMRGKRSWQVCCPTIDHPAEDHEQEDDTQEQEALIKEKSRKTVCVGMTKLQRQ
jgi:hypothetical protein